MNVIFKIAIRNLLRHKRRGIITALTIAIGLGLYIYIDSMMSGMNHGALQIMVNLTESAVKISTKEYETNKRSYPLKYGIKNYNEIRKYLKKELKVKGVTKRAMFLSEVSDYVESIPVMGTAIDPQTDSEVFKLKDYIIQGSYFTGKEKNEILIGDKLAKEFGVEAGGYIGLSAMNVHDAQNLDDFKIVGIFQTSAIDLDNSTIYLSYDSANEFIDLNNLTSIVFVHGDWKKGVSYQDFFKQIDALNTKISSRFKHLYTEPISKAAKGFISMVKGKEKNSGVIPIIVLIIAAVGIINSVLMSVYERIREVGVMRAIGFKGREIKRMFIYEGMIIGIIGSLFAMLLVFPFNLHLVNNGLDFAGMYDDSILAGLPMGTKLYGQWKPSTFVFVFVFGSVISYLSSILPARKAAKMEVIRALRFE